MACSFCRKRHKAQREVRLYEPEGLSAKVDSRQRPLRSESDDESDEEPESLSDEGDDLYGDNDDIGSRSSRPRTSDGRFFRRVTSSNTATLSHVRPVSSTSAGILLQVAPEAAQAPVFPAPGVQVCNGFDSKGLCYATRALTANDFVSKRTSGRRRFQSCPFCRAYRAEYASRDRSGSGSRPPPVPAGLRRRCDLCDPKNDDERDPVYKGLPCNTCASSFGRSNNMSQPSACMSKLWDPLIDMVSRNQAMVEPPRPAGVRKRERSRPSVPGRAGSSSKKASPVRPVPAPVVQTARSVSPATYRPFASAALSSTAPTRHCPVPLHPAAPFRPVPPDSYEYAYPVSHASQQAVLPQLSSAYSAPERWPTALPHPQADHHSLAPPLGLLHPPARPAVPFMPRPLKRPREEPTPTAGEPEDAGDAARAQSRVRRWFGWLFGSGA